MLAVTWDLSWDCQLDIYMWPLHVASWLPPSTEVGSQSKSIKGGKQKLPVSPGLSLEIDLAFLLTYSIGQSSSKGLPRLKEWGHRGHEKTIMSHCKKDT